MNMYCRLADEVRRGSAIRAGCCAAVALDLGSSPRAILALRRLVFDKFLPRRFWSDIGRCYLQQVCYLK